MNALVSAPTEKADGPGLEGSLAQAFEEMETLAWNSGVSPVEPLGLLFRAQRPVLITFARLATEQQEAVQSIVRDTRAMLDAEVERLRKANTLAEATIRQLVAAGSAVEADAEKILAKMVQSVTPEIAKGVRDAVVVREHVHNRRVRYGFYAKGAAIVLGLMLAGYAAHVWQSWETTAAMQRCRETVLWDTSGRGYCAVDQIFTNPPRREAPDTRR
ncbi:hypothetical protein WDZ11_22345 (plasmid) [Roseomonas mucosa]|uniref:hypothetical protein n=1 Tax=Roseomonas mucosa TaxID=207340 RepID=UPI0030CF8568